MTENETVALNVCERFLLLALLPREANLATIKICRDLSEALSFSEEEHQTYGIEVRNDQIAWSKDGERQFEIGPTAREIIRTALRKLNQDEKVTVNHVSLFEKFGLVGELIAQPLPPIVKRPELLETSSSREPGRY